MAGRGRSTKLPTSRSPARSRTFRSSTRAVVRPTRSRPLASACSRLPAGSRAESFRRDRTIRSGARGARFHRSAGKTTSMPIDVRLPFDEGDDLRPDIPEPEAVDSRTPETIDTRIDARDRAGRARAVDPRYNVALEASAGTGKTRILVERYVNLLKAGVDPAEILALTFTRKAATEMRDRILARLREAGTTGELTAARWRELRDRTSDVAISTIDAFCLALLREFPLEADLDPGFSIADETEVPRLIDESLDRALRICRALAREDEHVSLVFAQLGDRRGRAGLAALLNQRIAAPAALRRYLD